MRNKIAKKLRKEAGVQTSTSNRLEYEFLKTEHKRKGKQFEPKFKPTKRQQRLNKSVPTKSTLNVPNKVKRSVRRKLKA